MDPGQAFGLVGGIYYLLLGGFAAITTAEALEEGDAAGLGTRVFRSVSKTTVFLGVPTLIGMLALLASESRGDGGGIMSRDMGLFVLFLVGALALLFLWCGAVAMGFLGVALARRLRPGVGALTVFLCVSAGPLFMATIATVQNHQQKMRRLQR